LWEGVEVARAAAARAVAREVAAMAVERAVAMVCLR
jgi:hypothetical protein